MHATLRKIGNSRGIIIPSAMIDQLDLQSEVEITLEKDALVIKPVKELRQGWFSSYDPQQDSEPLAQMQTLDVEQEDWEW